MRRRRYREPAIEWDPEIGAFRAIERTPATPLPPKPAARKSVTQLLMQSFGITTARRSSGLNVPEHLKPYVR